MLKYKIELNNVRLHNPLKYENINYFKTVRTKLILSLYLD